MVFGFHFTNSLIEVCEIYVLGKKHRDSFPIGKLWRAKKSFLVDSYLCLVDIPSNGNHRYFITFIYEFS